ncbi:unnamed protein product [Periconia digitata]|uniref:Zn(2)-C6 fungal-type domain-containing protein n=1 Tax=Periconia digitata TaxID=1303443 RepID=A0A9W4U3E4_9PLEO|nr:unnamed protein product [Periconia digitata]
MASNKPQARSTSDLVGLLPNSFSRTPFELLNDQAYISTYSSTPNIKMAGINQQSRSEYSAPDLACTRCRERKIRCGRERPECNNCERDGGATCVYQNPAKRVNHLKLLCDNFDLLQGRLGNMETSIARLAAATVRGTDRENSASPSQSAIQQNHSDDETGDVEGPSEVDNDCELHVFRNKNDMADRYHGPSSLFVLCKQFCTHFSSENKAIISGTHMQELLHSLCEAAGVSEPFPFHVVQPHVHLVPKQQAVTAVGHFLQHLDIKTDIFSKSNLLANLERIYSQPPKPGDDAWATCFKAIALLVLGMELSAQAKDALFFDFARSFLPSRVALVSPSLLNTPRLINVQTLILLSVAMQQFDSPGWADLTFTHACMLARTMGLHHVQMSPADTNAEENTERAKVFQSLYVQDRSLCITQGAVSWLPTHDSNIASQLRAAVGRQTPYSDRIRLSMIQDDLYRWTHATSRRKSSLSSKSHTADQSIEQQLNEYATAVGIFDYEAPFPPRQAMLMLEFLATRIIALQSSTKQDHEIRVRQDARASCLLLLIAHGEQDQAITEAFKSSTSDAPIASPRKKSLSAVETGTIPFGSLFDSFSVPSFFILLKGLFQNIDEKEATQNNTDLDLLRRVSACYSIRTSRMQCNHRKVSWLFEQLLVLMDVLKKAQHHQTDPGLPSIPIAEMIPQQMASHISHMSPFQPDMMDVSNAPVGPTHGQLPNLPSILSPSASLSWDNWMTMSSVPVPALPFSAANTADGHSSDTPDILAQMLNTSHSIPDPSELPSYLPTPASGSSNGRKRRKTNEESRNQEEQNGLSPLSDFLVSGQELPFHLIS